MLLLPAAAERFKLSASLAAGPDSELIRIKGPRQTCIDDRHACASAGKVRQRQ
jgi:hypothetical protein